MKVTGIEGTLEQLIYVRSSRTLSRQSWPDFHYIRLHTDIPAPEVGSPVFDETTGEPGQFAKLLTEDDLKADDWIMYVDRNLVPGTDRVYQERERV